MKKRKIHSPINDKIWEDFLQECKSKKEIHLLKESLSEDEVYSINLILKRIRIADNLCNGELFNYVNKGVGGFEESALRLHLFLNCIELTSRLFREIKHIHFSQWLDGKIKRNEEFTTPKEYPLLKKAKIVHQDYNKVYGVNQQYKFFFSEALNELDKQWLFNHVWAWKSKTMERWGGGGMKLFNPTKIENPKFEIDECFNKWLDLEQSKRLILISDVLYKCRNSYTHGLKPYTSPNDSSHKMWPEEMKEKTGIINRGDFLHIFEENVGLATNILPLTEVVRNCLIKVLNNFINKK